MELGFLYMEKFQGLPNSPVIIDPFRIRDNRTTGATRIDLSMEIRVIKNFHNVPAAIGSVVAGWSVKNSAGRVVCESINVFVWAVRI